MKTQIQQVIAYLERKEARERARLADEVRRCEDHVFTMGRLSMLRTILTDARKHEKDLRSGHIQYGKAKRKNQEGGRATGEA